MTAEQRKELRGVAMQLAITAWILIMAAQLWRVVTDAMAQQNGCRRGEPTTLTYHSIRVDAPGTGRGCGEVFWTDEWNKFHERYTAMTDNVIGDNHQREFATKEEALAYLESEWCKP